jgi:hypothetical protein
VVHPPHEELSPLDESGSEYLRGSLRRSARPIPESPEQLVRCVRELGETLGDGDFFCEAFEREVHHPLHLRLEGLQDPCLKHVPLLLAELILKDIGVDDAADPGHRDLEARGDFPVGCSGVREQEVHNSFMPDADLLDLGEAHARARPFAELEYGYMMAGLRRAGEAGRGGDFGFKSDLHLDLSSHSTTQPNFGSW